MEHTGRRTARILSAAATAALALLAVAGCAADDSGPDTGSTAASGSSGSPTAPATAPAPSDPMAGPAEGANADLSVTITSNGTDTSHRYRLVCVNGSPAQGTDHPQAQDACTFLDGDGTSLLTGTPKKQARCTQQTAGPQTAIVQGTLNGSPVQRGFSLSDGCKISAWKAAEALLGRGTASGAR